MNSNRDQQQKRGGVARLRQAGLAAVAGMAITAMVSPWIFLVTTLDIMEKRLDELSSLFDEIGVKMDRIEHRLETLASELRSLSDTPLDPATEPPCIKETLHEAVDRGNKP